MLEGLQELPIKVNIHKYNYGLTFGSAITKTPINVLLVYETKDKDIFISDVTLFLMQYYSST